MAVRVNKANRVEESQESQEENVNQGQNEAQASAQASTGPVAVPDSAPAASSGPRRGRKPGGTTGPRLMWGQAIDGRTNALDMAVIAGARAVNEKYQGRATLSDLLTHLKSDPIFTSNQHPDGPALSDLLTIGNLRIRWNFIRASLTYQRAQLPVSEGGLALDPSTVDLKEWASKAHRGEFRKMEEGLMKPRAEGGKDWPSLIVVRGAKSQSFGLSLDEI